MDLSWVRIGDVIIFLVALLFIGEVVYFGVHRIWRLLFGSRTTSNLGFSPNELSRFEVECVIAVLLARSVGQSIGIWPTHTINETKTSKAASNDGKASSTLTISGAQLTVTMPLKIGKSDVVAFHDAIGNIATNISSSDGLTMLFLSAISEAAQLLLLAKRQCPIKALGAVNVCNKFELLQPKVCRALCNGKVKVGEARATLSDVVRPRKRGLEFDLIVEIFAGDDRGNPVFRQVFTVLQFQKHKYPLASEASKERNSLQGQPIKLDAKIDMEGKDPQTWAAICKDYNPIHTSWLAAKLFGLPGRIAHGNHVVAKAIALTNTSTSEVLPESRAKTAWMQVDFKRPVKVPSKLEVETLPPACDAADSDATTGFRVLRENKVHVEGTIGQK